MNRGGLLLGLGALGVGVIALAAAGGETVKQGLGRFFSWAELTTSTTARRLGIDNTPTPEAQAAMRALVADVLDPLRQKLGRPIRISSGYRAPAVNRAIDGAESSQHMRGEAVDIKVDGMAAQELAAFILRAGLPVDQVIWYAPERGGHVHLSYTRVRANRRQAMHAPAGGGYLAYAPAAASNTAQV
jgi:zinc D-Ala-D-Ala carboxypeptidase